MDWDDYLRDEAEKYRKLAEETDDSLIKQELLELADICDKVANNIEDRMTAGLRTEIVHARKSTCLRGYAVLRNRRLRCGANGPERYSSHILQRQAIHCLNDEWHAVQDDFHPGRENDPSTQWKDW